MKREKEKKHKISILLGYQSLKHEKCDTTIIGFQNSEVKLLMNEEFDFLIDVPVQETLVEKTD